MEESREGVKKNRQISSSTSISMAHYSNPCEEDYHYPTGTNHFFQSSNFTPIAATMEKYPKQSPSMTTSKTNPEYEKTKNSHKSQQNGWIVACRQRSSMYKGTGKQKVIGSSAGGCRQQTASENNCSQGLVFSSQEEKQDINIHHSGCDNYYSYLMSSQHNGRDRDSKRKMHDNKSECQSSITLSHKYQPKSFQDIIGHEIIIRVMSNAVEKKKVARLYLFYGPNGTGKTSTARIFSMALHCESTSFNKPCWSCRGCARSPYVTKLFSGRFQRVTTLLQTISSIIASPGFTVFIVEESHLLTAEEWNELLSISEKKHRAAALVFVLITVDANMIPKSISAKCQKFCFPRLKNMDITLKLERIVAQEDIRIEEEALKLIATKAEGSLREAEHILDQLTLVGPRITGCIVQKFVGLVPQNELINLLAVALAGDIEKTVMNTRQLIATGVDTQAIAFQLASLITDVLSGAAMAIPKFSTLAGPSIDKRPLRTNTWSERLCHALKILVDAKMQARSSIDNITRIYAALLQIASQDVPNGTSSGFCLPKGVLLTLGDRNLSHSRSWANDHFMYKTFAQQNVDRIDLNTTNRSKPNTTNESIDKIMKCRDKEGEKEFNLACMRHMEGIWSNILENIRSSDMKEFLCNDVKLASLTLSSANAIIHLMFKTAEDRLAAQMSEESISEALKSSIGCPVTVHMSLEPFDMEIIQKCNASTNKCQLAECNRFRQQHQKPSIPDLVCGTNTGVTMHQSQSTCIKLAPLSYKYNKPQLTELKDSTLISQEQQDGFPTEETEATTVWPHQMEENQLEPSVSLTTNSLVRHQFKVDTHIMRTEKPEHRWLSLSSIQQSDASVEPYSQDILFKNAKNPKLQEGSSKVHEDLHLLNSAKSMQVEIAIEQYL